MQAAFEGTLGLLCHNHSEEYPPDDYSTVLTHSVASCFTTRGQQRHFNLPHLFIQHVRLHTI